MSLVVGGILAFLFLESPWRYLALIPLAAWEFFEIMIFLRWRGVRSITGREAIAGSTGRATRECAPEGQVRVNGQLWSARASVPIRSGESVVVTGTDGITLIVEPG